MTAPVDTAKLRDLAKVKTNTWCGTEHDDEQGAYGYVYATGMGPMRRIVPIANADTTAVAHFIAEACNAIVPLCNELDAAREEVAHLRLLIQLETDACDCIGEVPWRCRRCMVLLHGLKGGAT